MNSWLSYVLLSAQCPAPVAIFAKAGLQPLDANTATAVRVVIMALFLIGIVVAQSKLGLVGSILTQRSSSSAASPRP